MKTSAEILTCTRGPDGTPCGNVPAAGEPFKMGLPADGAHCRKCYQAGAAKKPQQPPKPQPVPTCAHRGEPTGETVTCRTCRGNVQFKVFACSKNGRCTVGRKVEGVALCDGSKP